jgi:hypothetical protein
LSRGDQPFLIGGRGWRSSLLPMGARDEAAGAEFWIAAPATDLRMLPCRSPGITTVAATPRAVSSAAPEEEIPFRWSTVRSFWTARCTRFRAAS